MTPEEEIPLPSRQEMMRMTGEIRKRFEAIVEDNRLQAKILKASFDGLVAEGFTQDQAMVIVTKRGPYIGGSG